MNICPLNVERANLVTVQPFKIKGCFPSQVTSDNVICSAPVSSPRLRLCREWNMDF